VKLSLDTVLPARAVVTASLMVGVRVTMILWTRPPSLAVFEALLTLLTLLLTLLTLFTWDWPKLLELLPPLENPVLEVLEPWRALATAAWMVGLRELSTEVTMLAEFLLVRPEAPEL